MASRDATLADAPEISRFLGDFLEVTVPDDNTRARIQDENIITTINPGRGYCQIKVRPREQSVKIEALFPRGESVTRLRPILNRALQGVLLRFPTAGRWRVWAQFWDPKGEDGRFDGGEGEVRAWAAAYPPGMVEVVPPDRPGDLWTGQSTIGRMT